MRYLKNEAPCFKNVIDADNLTLSFNTSLDYRPKQKEAKEEEEDNGVTDSKKKAVKKRNKHTKK